MSHQVCPTVWTWSICRAAVFQAAGCQGVGCANGCEGDALVISVVPRYNLWLFNIAMENGPFIDDFPSYKPPFMVGIFHGYVQEPDSNHIMTSKNTDFKPLKFWGC